MKKINYLIFNLIILFLPLISYFFYKNMYFPKFFPFIISIILSAFLFIIHDIKVNNKWWSFNNKYIIGLKIFNLPVEEYLFFIVISFSCLVIWENLKIFSINYSFISIILIFLIFFVYFNSRKLNREYTKFVIFTNIILIFLDKILKINLFLNPIFNIYILIIFFLTLFFNYYLTKKPIVVYNEKYNSGKKILTIPIEDFFYGINFIYLLTISYEYFLNYLF